MKKRLPRNGTQNRLFPTGTPPCGMIGRIMWKRKKMTYDICIPPVNKPYALLNSKEAEAYFKWYMDKIPARIRYLSGKCSDDLGINRDRINLSPESLVIIWKWFLNVAATENTEVNGLQFDLQTEYIVRDIGMFLGEMFRFNYESIKWSYFESPKTDFFVNKPLLIGFKDNSVFPPFDAVFEPIHMVRVQASKILNNQQKDNDLLKLYNKWSRKIPDETGDGPASRN